MYDQVNIICAIIVLVTSMLGIYFNTAIIVAFYRMSKTARSKTSNILLVNQAFADLSTVVPSLLDSVFVYYLMVEHKYLHEIYCAIFFFFYLTDPTSITSLAIYVAHGAVSIKASQSRIFSKRNTLAAIAMVWIISYALAVFSVVYENSYQFMVGYNIYVFIVIASIVAFLVFSYKSHPSSSCRRVVEASTLVPYDEMANATNGQNQNRLLKSMILRGITLLATDLPHCVISAIILHGEPIEQMEHIAIWLILWMLSTLHPILNSLITIFLVEDFKLARKWLTFGKCGTTSPIEHDREDEDEFSIVVDEL